MPLPEFSLTRLGAGKPISVRYATDEERRRARVEDIKLVLAAQARERLKAEANAASLKVERVTLQREIAQAVTHMDAVASGAARQGERGKADKASAAAAAAAAVAAAAEAFKSGRVDDAVSDEALFREAPRALLEVAGGVASSLSRDVQAVLEPVTLASCNGRRTEYMEKLRNRSDMAEAMLARLGQRGRLWTRRYEIIGKFYVDKLRHMRWRVSVRTAFESVPPPTLEWSNHPDAEFFIQRPRFIVALSEAIVHNPALVEPRKFDEFSGQVFDFLDIDLRGVIDYREFSALITFFEAEYTPDPLSLLEVYYRCYEGDMTGGLSLRDVLRLACAHCSTPLEAQGILSRCNWALLAAMRTSEELAKATLEIARKLEARRGALARGEDPDIRPPTPPLLAPFVALVAAPSAGSHAALDAAGGPRRAARRLSVSMTDDFGRVGLARLRAGRALESEMLRELNKDLGAAELYDPQRAWRKSYARRRLFIARRRVGELRPEARALEDARRAAEEAEAEEQRLMAEEDAARAEADRAAMLAAANRLAGAMVGGAGGELDEGDVQGAVAGMASWRAAHARATLTGRAFKRTKAIADSFAEHAPDGGLAPGTFRHFRIGYVPQIDDSEGGDAPWTRGVDTLGRVRFYGLRLARERRVVEEQVPRRSLAALGTLSHAIEKRGPGMAGARSRQASGASYAALSAWGKLAFAAGIRRGRVPAGMPVVPVPSLITKYAVPNPLHVYGKLEAAERDAYFAERERAAQAALEADLAAEAAMMRGIDAPSHDDDGTGSQDGAGSEEPWEEAAEGGDRGAVAAAEAPEGSVSPPDSIASNDDPTTEAMDGAFAAHPAFTVPVKALGPYRFFPGSSMLERAPRWTLASISGVKEDLPLCGFIARASEAPLPDPWAPLPPKLLPAAGNGSPGQPAPVAAAVSPVAGTGRSGAAPAVDVGASGATGGAVAGSNGGGAWSAHLSAGPGSDSSPQSPHGGFGGSGVGGGGGFGGASPRPRSAAAAVAGAAAAAALADAPPRGAGGARGAAAASASLAAASSLGLHAAMLPGPLRQRSPLHAQLVALPPTPKAEELPWAVNSTRGHVSDVEHQARRLAARAGATLPFAEHKAEEIRSGRARPDQRVGISLPPTIKRLNRAQMRSFFQGSPGLLHEFQRLRVLRLPEELRLGFLRAQLAAQRERAAGAFLALSDETKGVLAETTYRLRETAKAFYGWIAAARKAVWVRVAVNSLRMRHAVRKWCLVSRAHILRVRWRAVADTHHLLAFKRRAFGGLRAASNLTRIAGAAGLVRAATYHKARVARSHLRAWAELWRGTKALRHRCAVLAHKAFHAWVSATVLLRAARGIALRADAFAAERLAASAAATEALEERVSLQHEARRYGEELEAFEAEARADAAVAARDRAAAERRARNRHAAERAAAVHAEARAARLQLDDDAFDAEWDAITVDGVDAARAAAASWLDSGTDEAQRTLKAAAAGILAAPDIESASQVGSDFVVSRDMVDGRLHFKAQADVGFSSRAYPRGRPFLDLVRETMRPGDAELVAAAHLVAREGALARDTLLAEREAAAVQVALNRAAAAVQGAWRAYTAWRSVAARVERDLEIALEAATGAPYVTHLPTGRSFADPPRVLRVGLPVGTRYTPRPPPGPLPEFLLRRDVGLYAARDDPWGGSRHPPEGFLLCRACTDAGRGALDFARRRCWGEGCGGLLYCAPCFAAAHPLPEWASHWVRRSLDGASGAMELVPVVAHPGDPEACPRPPPDEDERIFVEEGDGSIFGGSVADTTAAWSAPPLMLEAEEGT